MLAINAGIDLVISATDGQITFTLTTPTGHTSTMTTPINDSLGHCNKPKYLVFAAPNPSGAIYGESWVLEGTDFRFGVQTD